MINNLSITAIIENTAGIFEVAGEWGLALSIQADQHRILCDTGQGHTCGRMRSGWASIWRRLRHSSSVTATPIIPAASPALMAAGFRGKTYIHPAALNPKYQREKTAPPRAKGIPAESREALLTRTSDLVECCGPVEIAPGILVTGAIPRRNSYEDVPDPFFLDENCTEPDPLVDDQALLIETARGLAVITGCGHSGLINTLNYARELTGNSRIAAVVGGLHLFRASAERIRATTENLRDFGAELIAPCHCTGFDATGDLQHEFGSSVVALRAGLTIRLSEA